MIESGKVSLKILQDVADNHRRSSGFSSYSKSSKKRIQSEFSNGLNLSAYQKKMITPTDVFGQPKEKLTA